MKKLKFILVSCAALPFGCLPLSWSQAIGAWLGRTLIRLNKKRLEVAYRNISACFPELSEQEKQDMVIKTAEESGKWFFESAYVWFRNPELLKKKMTVNNPEVLQTAFDSQKGVLIILPHLGNFELLNFYVPFHFPFAAMYKPIKSELGEEIVFKGRSRVGTSMFSVDTRGVRAALKHLKKGKVLAVLSDHLPSYKSGVFAPFFGIPAHTGKLTQSLAKFNHSEVLLASVLRLPKGKGFELKFYPVTGVDAEDPIEAATAVNKAIEDAIRLCPEQYQWVYKRFSRQEDGSSTFYK